METKRKAKGSWGVRFFIVVLGIILGVLFYWLLNFVVRDIGKIERPDKHLVRRQYISEEIDDQKGDLEKELRRLNSRIGEMKEQKHILADIASSSKGMVDQLISIQKDNLAENAEFSEKNEKILQENHSIYLENKNKVLGLNEQISGLILKRQEKDVALATVTDQIKALEVDVDADYLVLEDKHDFKVAVVKFSFLVPVFLAVSLFFMKFRKGAYWPLLWSVFIASFIKISLVVQEEFETEYFKYIALFVVLAIVLRILIYLIRLIVAPKKDLLIKQYQQFYDKHRCPVCTKPIKAPDRCGMPVGRKRRWSLHRRERRSTNSRFTTARPAAQICMTNAINVIISAIHCCRTANTAAPKKQPRKARNNTEIYNSPCFSVSGAEKTTTESTE
ncbi:MAG: hypothetical protein ACYSSK_09850 [Planctomycetota bacterium]|jgi:hypothetical protein